MFFEVFLIKFVECAFGTLKTTLLIKGKYLLSTISNSLSSLLLILVASTMANSDDKFTLGIIIFCANMLGGYIPPRIVKYFEKDKLYIYNITADSFEEGIIFADNLRASGIPVVTSIMYNQRLDKVLHIRAHAKTKEESSIINCYLAELNYKYHVVENKSK